MTNIAKTTTILDEVKRDVLESEVFLSFACDEVAINFTEWLECGEGWDAFRKWLDQRAPDDPVHSCCSG